METAGLEGKNKLKRAELLKHVEDAQGSLEDMQTLLPIFIKTGSENPPGTLMTTQEYKRGQQILKVIDSCIHYLDVLNEGRYRLDEIAVKYKSEALPYCLGLLAVAQERWNQIQKDTTNMDELIAMARALHRMRTILFMETYGKTWHAQEVRNN